MLFPAIKRPEIMGNMPNKRNADGRSIVAYANDKKPPAAAGGLRPSGSSRVICGAEIIPLPPKKASDPGPLAVSLQQELICRQQVLPWPAGHRDVLLVKAGRDTRDRLRKGRRQPW